MTETTTNKSMSEVLSKHVDAAGEALEQAKESSRDQSIADTYLRAADGHIRLASLAAVSIRND